MRWKKLWPVYLQEIESLNKFFVVNNFETPLEVVIHWSASISCHAVKNNNWRKRFSKFDQKEAKSSMWPTRNMLLQSCMCMLNLNIFFDRSSPKDRVIPKYNFDLYEMFQSYLYGILLIFYILKFNYTLWILLQKPIGKPL